MSRSESNPDDTLPEFTPTKLRLLRRWELDLTIEKLAEKARCEARTVQRYEKGDSPIPADFVRMVERLRVEERARRARELGEDEIDWNSLIVPGLELIELLPIRKVAGKLFRMFIAVPKDDAASEQPPQPAANHAAQTVPLLLARGRLPEGTVLVENVLSVAVETSESQTRSFSAVRGVVLPPDPKTGQSMAVAKIIQVPSTPKT